MSDYRAERRADQAAAAEQARIDQAAAEQRRIDRQAAADERAARLRDQDRADREQQRQAKLQRRTGDYAAAVATLSQITSNPKYDALSDDALFLTAEIQEENIKDKPKAQGLYQEVLTKYPGSIYVAEARKRFRRLRGDAVQ